LVGFAAILPHGGVEGFLNHVLAAGSHHVAEAAEESAGHMEHILMIISVIAGLAGVSLAASMYLKDVPSPKSIGSAFRPIYTLLYHKYYVDELYFFFIVNPLVGGSRQVLWKFVDVVIIDGTVNGVAKVCGWIGGGLRYLQTGVIAHYAIGILGGAVVLYWLRLLFG
jgi:NADH-quinone oxidoreductase subunit L